MYRTNRDHAICFESLEETLAKSPETYGHIDLLCGGWPCQDNSIAGKRKGHAGEKSGLWKEMARLLRLFKPKWFLGENVPGLLSVNGGKDFSDVIVELQEIGYGVSWRILNSQFFGVAQRRRRLFIVGHFGEPCPPQILFEPKGDNGNYQPKQEMGSVGLCISTRDREHHDPTRETIIAKTILTNDQKLRGLGADDGNLVASTLRQKDNDMQKEIHKNFVAFTIGKEDRGQPYKLHTKTFIAKIDANRERTSPRFPRGLDSLRGILIGNAVSVPVAEWIGKRIIEFELAKKLTINDLCRKQYFELSRYKGLCQECDNKLYINQQENRRKEDEDEETDF